VDTRAIAFAVPFFFALIGVEIWLSARRRRRATARGEAPTERTYRFADTITSLACGVGQQVLAVLFVTGIATAAYTFLYEHVRLFTIPTSSVAGWIAVTALVDLAYYAYHRASHRINFFWATHVVHHQSEDYNLGTALRQSWFTGITSWIFYAPLALLGFSPVMFLVAHTANTLYQFWIHTRLVDKLGAVEKLLNTPSHHRVHHGIDPEYIDKNYAGIFIVWDRLFGTFIEEKREPAYGTVKPLASFNPFWANLEGFARIARMSLRTRRLRDKIWAWFAPPEWQPEDLGGVVTVPEVDRAARVKFAVPVSPLLRGYVVAHFAVVTLGVSALLWWWTTWPAQKKLMRWAARWNQ
jgi:sterol desaturase/sphingolipid hydroxylase (fatty acid hydroxylase superfamily)